MIEYKNKINSFLISMEKFGSLLWKCLSFSLADNFFSIAKVVCISMEADGIYFVFGTKIFRKISIKYSKKFPLDEDKELTPEYLATVVSMSLEEIDAAKASFVLSIPRSWTIVQTVELPATVKDNLANVISYELDRLTPLNPENAYYDYKIIAENEKKISVLLIVAKADRLNPFLEVLGGRNIKIEKLNISAFSIKSLIKNVYHIKNSVFIAVNERSYECGAIINDVTIRSISGTLRSLDDSQIDQIIKETLPLIDLLTKSGPDKAGTRIVINADEKYYKLFSEKLSHLPVFHLNRDNKLGLPDVNRDISPSAVGGFLERITDDHNAVNLLAEKNGKQKTTPFLATFVLLTVMILIGFFYVLSPIVIGQKNIDRIDNRINSLKPEMKKIEALKKEINMISSDIKVINDFKKQRIMKIDVLKEITNILPAKSWLTRVRITEDVVEIEGYATSATEIIPRLENSKFFQKADFSSPTFRDPRQNNERFVINMELKNENKPKKPEEAYEKHEKKK